MRYFYRLILLKVLCFGFVAGALPQNLFGGSNGRSENAHWNLADWLAQKNSMSLMNQWLVLNTSSPLFDISASGSAQSYKLKTEAGGVSSSKNENSQSYDLDLYIAFVGIHGEYEKTGDSREGFGGSLGLRLLGDSSRSTFLTLHYGLRILNDLSNQEKWENQYAQGELQMYLIGTFGLSGKYRHYFPADSNLGNRMEGSRATAGAFFDLFFFRVYGNYFQEPMVVTSAGLESTQNRTGFDYGVRLFF